MSEFKVTITCPNCNQKLRFPILEKKIRFACPNCNKLFQAINGKIIDTNLEKDADYQYVPNSQDDNLKDKSKIWKAITSLLLVIIAVLATIWYTSGNEERNKNTITDNFITSLKNSKGDYTIAKEQLTPETQELFDLLIKSQQVYKDSISLEMINKFIGTLEPLDYGVSRKFMYQNIKGDTLYFYADYKLIRDTYKIQVTMDEFLK